jgi:hypothetical protein
MARRTGKNDQIVIKTSARKRMSGRLAKLRKTKDARAAKPFYLSESDPYLKESVHCMDNPIPSRNQVKNYILKYLFEQNSNYVDTAVALSKPTAEEKAFHHSINKEKKKKKAPNMSERQKP